MEISYQYRNIWREYSDRGALLQVHAQYIEMPRSSRPPLIHFPNLSIHLLMAPGQAIPDSPNTLSLEVKLTSSSSL